MAACDPGTETGDNENGTNDDNGKNGKTESVTPEQMLEKGFSLKFNYTYSDEIAIFTRKGVSTRLDVFYDSTDEDGNPIEMHRVYIETKGADGNYTGYGYPDDYGDGDVWTDDDYSARQTANNAFAVIKDMSAHFLEHGYQAKGTTTICGKTCNVYEGTYDKGTSRLIVYDGLGEDGLHGSFATWNGYALRATCDKREYDDNDQLVVTGTKTVFECQTVQIGVPDAAFTKTLDITWIK